MYNDGLIQHLPRTLQSPITGAASSPMLTRARCCAQGRPAARAAGRRNMRSASKHEPLTPGSKVARATSRPAATLPPELTRWSSRFWNGPFVVDTAWPAIPRQAIMARRPLRISLVCRGNEGGARWGWGWGVEAGPDSRRLSPLQASSLRAQACLLCSLVAAGRPPRTMGAHLQLLHGLRGLAQVEHVEELAARVGRVARAAQHGLQAQEVLLGLGAGVLEVLQQCGVGWGVGVRRARSQVRRQILRPLVIVGVDAQHAQRNSRCSMNSETSSLLVAAWRAAYARDARRPI